MPVRIYRAAWVTPKVSGLCNAAWFFALHEQIVTNIFEPQLRWQGRNLDAENRFVDSNRGGRHVG
jgi:hypothetical protein